ncbi:hypothetical protein K438DRAFT_1961850 [Mycena galopus ATCC 62051]|nr:hypothetical protein K438DRAFT_1961850 [Mycena galopus ATCC 62051]
MKHFPAAANEVWISVQDAPDAACEEVPLVGELALCTCFLSPILNGELSLEAAVVRPSGFFGITDHAKRSSLLGPCCANLEGWAPLAQPHLASCLRRVSNLCCCPFAPRSTTTPPFLPDFERRYFLSSALRRMVSTPLTLTLKSEHLAQKQTI